MSAEDNTSIECDALVGDDSWLSDPSVNFTLVFTSCPTTCLIAYGSANPDLAGIGVGYPLLNFDRYRLADYNVLSQALVSYATLALLNFTFTIPLLFSYFFLLRPTGRQRLRKLYQRFFIAETMLIIPILIACVVLVSTGPSIFEVFVATSLCFYAMAGLGCLVLMELNFVFAASFGEQEKIHSSWSLVGSLRGWRSWGFKLLAMLSQINAYFHHLCHGRSEDDGQKASHARRVYFLGLVIGIILSLVTLVQWTVLSETPFHNAWTLHCQGAPLTGWPYVFIFVGPAILSFLAFLVALCLGSSILRVCVHTFILAVLYSLLALHVVYLVNIVYGALAMSSFDGEEETVLEWGFGQVLSVFVWVPSLCDLGLWVLRVIKGGREYWKTQDVVICTARFMFRGHSYRSDELIVARRSRVRMENPHELTLQSRC